MSSAALQTAPHSSSLSNLPSSASPSASYHANLSAAANNNNNNPNTSSPASSRRPSRRPSASGPGQGGTTPPSPSPNASQAGLQTGAMTSRAAATASSPVPVSAAVAAVGSSEMQTASPSSSSRRRQQELSVPPRTSSNNPSRRAQQAVSYAGPGSASERGASSPRHEANGNVDSGRTNGSRRAQQQQQQVAEPPPRGSSNRPVTTSLPVRSHANQPARDHHAPSHEPSELLSRDIVSDPAVDVQRTRERQYEAEHGRVRDDAAPSPVVSMGPGPDHQQQQQQQQQPVEEERRTTRSRHDHSGRRERTSRFQDYYLGNTIGEGEFGKVKLGWKQDGGVQVAIKLIRKDSVGSNPSRLAKIYREIAILKELQHPNIVRLHESVETDKHIGIILEYASGGELFDYILNHRYLKDNAARKLFAQLVSGVGYLHKKGIVHRDLKLENLLLDQNRNIIITDFGFANTFNSDEELTEEEEQGLTDKEFVERIGLNRINARGMRKADLMQTSCGSPCYAAPELVVSDSLYTGRKVDVWSCGVILYAMLAGYLPFDDDPANPEGDNINLLYKYIVSTPLTFPEYVTPHARDLLRRILVANPRKRADLFEVARHSWLSDYAHIVEKITSVDTNSGNVQRMAGSEDDDSAEGPQIGRSASVREAPKAKTAAAQVVGGLATKQGNIDQQAQAQAQQAAEAAEAAAAARANKRRTVQVEYVAPTTATVRGAPESSSAHGTPAGKTKARSGSQGPVEVAAPPPADKPLPQDPAAYGRPAERSARPPSAHRNQAAAPPSRPGRDSARAISDGTYITTAAAGARPQTGESGRSAGALGGGAKPSYGQPIPPAVANTNVQGRIQQPKGDGPGGNNKAFVISGPVPAGVESGRASVSMPSKAAHLTGFPAADGEQAPMPEGRGHKRSSTLGEIGKMFGRSGSVFSKNRKRSEAQQQQAQAAAAAAAQQQQPQQQEKRRYPPVSMANSKAQAAAAAAAAGSGSGGEESGGARPSMDSRRSRRSFSLAMGMGKKRSGSITGSQGSQEKPQHNQQQHNRRSSLIPASVIRAIGLGKDSDRGSQRGGNGDDSQSDLPIQDPPPQPHVRHNSREPDEYHRYVADQVGQSRTGYDLYDDQLPEPLQTPPPIASPGAPRFASGQYERQSKPTTAIPPHMQQYQQGPGPAMLSNDSESSLEQQHQQQQQQQQHRRAPSSAPYQAPTFDQIVGPGPPVSSGGGGGGGFDGRRMDSRRLQKPPKKFSDGYGGDAGRGGGSGAAKRVMDFFRRSGRIRGGEDR